MNKIFLISFFHVLTFFSPPFFYYGFGDTVPKDTIDVAVNAVVNEEGILHIKDNDILKGAGIINGHIINKGLISPGHSPGLIEVRAMTLEEEGVLLIELGGTDFNQFDRIVVDEEVNLGGKLEVELIDGYSPHVGDEFEFINFGESFSDFSEMSGLDLGDGLYLMPILGLSSYKLRVVDSSPQDVVVSFNPDDANDGSIRIDTGDVFLNDLYESAGILENGKGVMVVAGNGVAGALEGELAFSVPSLNAGESLVLRFNNSGTAVKKEIKLATDYINISFDQFDGRIFSASLIEDPLDVDRDGWKDETEMLFGSTPSDPESVPAFKMIVQKFENGQFQVLFPGERDVSYTIQISSNLKDWIVLGDPIIGNGNIVRECFKIAGNTSFLRITKN